ncbi:MAG: hypothetical protein J6C37_03120 [Roseburia sp.]|nr:hypothetical protein [Roseburia sp.]
MERNYVETPHNFQEINSYVITEKAQIVQEVLCAEKCFFYDTCSFRKHANMAKPECFFEYVKRHQGIIFITRCVLMELASISGNLNLEYIAYVKRMHAAGIKVLVAFEEYVFDIMNVCFTTYAAINNYLSWAVRMVKHPTSTIQETLKKDEKLFEEVIKLDDITDGTLYKRFFVSVRADKKSDDNLGEELIAICIHILSHMIGEKDGKFCVITEDKGAIGMIDHVFQKTNALYRGKKIIIYSTPKLVQHMYVEKILTEKQQIEEMLRGGNNSGNIIVWGTELYDIKNREISISCSELAEKIATPNGIHIVY